MIPEVSAFKFGSYAAYIVMWIGYRFLHEMLANKPYTYNYIAI